MVTEPRYLLDTNICIYIAKRQPPEVRRRFADLAAGEAAISLVTWAELLYGVEGSSRRREAHAVLAELRRALPVLSLSEDTAGHYASIRSELRRSGEIIGNNDLWIAAHARSLGTVLVTNNEREFQRVPGLVLENWARS